MRGKKTAFLYLPNQSYVHVSKVIVSFVGIEIWPTVEWLCGLELGINSIAKACTRYLTLFMVCVPVLQQAQQMVMGMRLNLKLQS